MGKAEYKVAPTYGRIAGTAIVASLTASANPVITPPGVTRLVYGYFNGDQPVVLTVQYPGEAAVDWVELANPSAFVGSNVVIDMGASDLRLPPGTIIGVLNRGSPPTTGSLALTAM